MKISLKGRDIILKPTCPFCGQLINKPEEIHNSMPHEMPIGACNCGAVYSCDETGHNLGAAMIEALLFACNGDWDLAWDLLPEDDYQVAEIIKYDYTSHLIISSRAYEGRNVTGVLYFIKLHDDVLEVTEEGFRRKLENMSKTKNNNPEKGNKLCRITKVDVERLVSAYNISGIVEAAGKDKKIIPFIQRLLYSADDLKRLRAADAMGKATAVIAGYDPGTVSKLLKNIFMSILDTAASNWGAIDAIGYIISNMPGIYASYVPQLYPFLTDRALLPHVLRALCVITAAMPEPFSKIRFRLLSALKENDPEILAYTVIIMGNLRVKEALPDIMALKNDTREISIYEEGRFKKMTVGEIADSVTIMINT